MKHKSAVRESSLRRALAPAETAEGREQVLLRADG